MDCLVRVGAGYLMWHSFRAAWAIGPRHLSEGFTLGSTRLAPELRQFPNARPVPYTL